MNKKYINQLADAFVSIRSRGIAESFLHNILTPAELEEVSLRLQIVKLLLTGLPQREVAKKLGVSMGTVSRGSRELKYGADGFKKVLQRD
jgi:TrpR family transcriptional regulator, trp operon repressor